MLQALSDCEFCCEMQPPLSPQRHSSFSSGGRGGRTEKDNRHTCINWYTCHHYKHNCVHTKTASIMILDDQEICQMETFDVAYNSPASKHRSTCDQSFNHLLYLFTPSFYDSSDLCKKKNEAGHMT